MRAEILSVGTELLLGEILDTNANYLAQQLPALGIDLYFISSIGDNLQRLSEAIQRGLQRSDLIITTGGIGPTDDDMTREAIAAVMGEQMTVQDDLLQALRERMERSGRPMPPSNRKQATTIPSGTYLANPIGTAPGWWVERDGKIIVSMPGVPHEMVKMWEEQAVPRLVHRVGAGALMTRTLKLIGIGESAAEERVKGLVQSVNPTLATYAKPDGVHLRMAAKADTREQAQQMLAEFEPRVRAQVGQYVYGYDNDQFPGVVGQLLRERGLSLAVAESATAGALASLIADAPGASDYLRGGVVVYSRAAKEELGVPKAVLDEHGTISQPTSLALAAAVRERYGADVAVATTGVAGPDPAEGQPVGTLHVAVNVRGQAVAHTGVYRSTRTEYKRRSALDALQYLWRALREPA